MQTHRPSFPILYMTRARSVNTPVEHGIVRIRGWGRRMKGRRATCVPRRRMHSIDSADSRYVPQLPEPQHSQPHVVQSQVPFSQQPQHSQSGQPAGRLPSRAGTMDARPSVAQSKKPFMRKLPVMGLETESITPRHDA